MDADLKPKLELEIEQLKEDVRYLSSFIPQWAKEVPSGLSPTFYGTLTEEGDNRVKSKVDAILERSKQTPDKGDSVTDEK